MLYGRMFLPRSTVEALYLRRLSPTRQIKVSCVSDVRLKNGGTVCLLPPKVRLNQA
jgi:distribution and morphology protein 10